MLGHTRIFIETLRFERMPPCCLSEGLRGKRNGFTWTLEKKNNALRKGAYLRFLNAIQ